MTSFVWCDRYIAASRTAVATSLFSAKSGRVVGVDAVPDHRRLVADRVDLGQQPVEQAGVTDVAADQLVAVGPLRRLALRVRLGEQGIEQDGGVSAVGELVGDRGTDESGSAGQEDAHGRHGSPGISDGGPCGRLARV